MKLLTCLIALLVSSAASKPNLVLGQVTEDKKLEIQSLHEAHLANIESITSMDVNFLHSKLRSCESTLAHEEVTIRQRLVFDPENLVGVFATIYELKGFQEGEDSLDGKKLITVVLQIGERIATRQFPQPTSWNRVTETTNFESVSDQPDFRFLGRYPFPMAAGAISEETVQAILQHGGMFQDGVALRVLSEDRMAVVYPFRDGSHQTKSQRFFDSINSIITGVRSSSRSKDGTVSPRLTERYRWEEVDSIFLPVSISGEQNRTRASENGKRHLWNDIYDIELRWHSVNQPIQRDDTHEEMLLDANKVLEFIEAKGVAVIAGKSLAERKRKP